MHAPFQLRKYQARHLTKLLHALEAGDDVLYSAPTGAGKSTVVTAAVQSLSQGDWNGAVVTVPMLSIRSGFVRNAAAEPGTFDAALYNDSKSSVRAVFGKWIRKHWQDRAFASVICRQSFEQVSLPRDLQGWVLFIDEAHSSTVDTDENSPILSRKRKEWVNRGGRVVIVSATPYRPDGKPVYDDSYVQVRRSIAEHSLPERDGQRYAPERFEIRASSLDDYRVRTEQELHGDKAPRHIGPRAIEQLVKSWRASGYPKTIVIVPPGNSKSWSQRVVAAFARESVPYRGGGKAEVHNAVGTGAVFQRDLAALLDSERAVTRVNDSKVDVIVACCRFNEGTDWPLCSHVFQVGFPSSVRLTNQRWGRAFRSKANIVAHPHPGIASISFFVPEFTEDLRRSLSTGEAERLHMRMALLMAGHLEDHEAGQRLIGVIRDIVKLNTPFAPLSVDVEALEEQLQPTDEELADVNVAFRHLRDDTTVDTVTQLNHVAEHFNLDERRQMLLRMRLMLHVRQTDEDLYEELAAAVHAAAKSVIAATKTTPKRSMKARRVPGPAELMPAEAIALFDALVLEKHAGLIRFDPPITEKHWYMLSQFTGRQAQDIERNLRAALNCIPTGKAYLDCVASGARKWLRATGNRPAILSGDASAYVGFPTTWRAIDRKLGSLQSFLNEQGIGHAYFTGLNGSVYENAVANGARAWIAEFGKRPSKASGDATAYVGFKSTWGGVCRALRVGSNGARKVGGLRAFLDEQCIGTPQRSRMQ